MSRPEDYPVMAEFEWLLEGRRAHALRGERDDHNDYIQLHSDWYHPQVFNRLTCPDGFSISVQGSSFNYSYPRDNLGPYSEVELGFPKRVTKYDRDYLAPFGEYLDHDTRIEDLVFPYVTVDIIRELLFWHCVGRSSPGKHVILGVILVLLTLLIVVLA
jgi:hypothetical protein